MKNTKAKRKLKDQKAITLIALVITIIVLLILAAVTMITLTGENGILNRAKESAEQTEMKAIEERANLVKTDLLMDGILKEEKLSRITLLMGISKEFKDGLISGNKVIVENKKYDIKVDANLNITVQKHQSANNVAELNVDYEVLVIDNDNAEIYLYVDSEMLYYSYDDYEAYARTVLSQRTPEEIKEMFYEGEKFEYEDYYQEEYPGQEISKQLVAEDYGYSSYEELINNIATDYGYSSLEDLLVNWEYVEREKFMDMIAEVEGMEEADYEITNVQGYSIKKLDVGIFRCIVPKGNTYNFVVTFLGESKNVEVVVSDDELDPETIFDFDPETGAIALKNAKLSATSYADHVTGNGEVTKLSTIVIPNEINGVTVKRIGINRLHVGEDKNTYYTQGINSTYVEKIMLPDTIEEIYKNAFYGCTNLTDITIQSGVTSIGESAFSGCSSLTKIIIPDSVTSIGKLAFRECYSLTDITLSNSLTNIDVEAFEYCTNLTNIILPDSVTNIGSEAFYYCSSLTSITIPRGVTNIGYSIFKGCTGLKEISVDSNNNNYSSEDHILFNKDKSKIICYPIAKDGKEYNIPTGVKEIEGNAFYECRNLTNIIIPNSVTYIGNYAFENCSSLTNITIPNTVTSIGQGAFENCSSLTDITIPNGVNIIDYYTFYRCNSLTNITIPDSVTHIDGGAFSGCESLTDVYYKGTEEQWQSIYVRYGNESLTNATIHYNQ